MFTDRADTHSPVLRRDERVGKNIAFIYLPLELAKEGTALEVEVFGERVRAEVAADVLYDPKGERLKA